MKNVDLFEDFDFLMTTAKNAESQESINLQNLSMQQTEFFNTFTPSLIIEILEAFRLIHSERSEDAKLLDMGASREIKLISDKRSCERDKEYFIHLLTKSADLLEEQSIKNILQNEIKFSQVVSKIRDELNRHLA